MPNNKYFRWETFIINIIYNIQVIVKNLPMLSQPGKEGNRFKLINHSKNGTYFNGKRILEAYLKDGDVLIFSQGGPRVRFLTEKNVSAGLPDNMTKADER
jgi:pSer/pThr/pTyr-binding forkhead associated (FHA) protein